MNANLHSAHDSQSGMNFDNLDFEIEGLEFTDEPEVQASLDNPWRVLIVDDDEQIHTVTTMAIRNFRFQDRPLEILHAFSGQEARDIMKKESGIALVLLDVVMETDQAGLETVEYIRNALGNTLTRVVLRTGQPGLAPEKEVISEYDIDDYKDKTDLTVDKLNTLMFSSLRAYGEMMRIEGLVRERTARIEEQNDELKRKNQDIVDSMTYARRIQTALLPPVEYINQYVNNFYVFFKPKDIVSGDLYWFSRIGDASIVANIDCTGHGIPGALMSIFAYNLLNQVVNFELNERPAEILYSLDEKLRGYLESQHGNEENHVRDGMDLTVMRLDHTTQEVSFASANRPVYHFSSGELEVIDGDKNPIGSFAFYPEKQFTEHKRRFANGDRIFLFTDGITDQFGGENGKKFTSKRLRELLLATIDLTLGEQMSELNSVFEEWKKAHSQTDDISFLAIQP